VSLAPSITETVFALGAGDAIVGVTDYCDYPEEARAKTSVGGIVNPSIEAIVGLSPDLILMSVEGNLRDSFQSLTDLNIPVFVSNPRTLEGIYKSILDIGSLTGKGSNGEELVKKMRERIAFSLPRSEQPTVLLVISVQPLIVLGSGTYLSEILQLAGGRNVAGGSSLSYPTLSREAVVAAKPDVMIFTSDIFVGRDILLEGYPEWAGLPAFTSGRVFPIEADLVSRPGPRIVDALEEITRLLGRKSDGGR
jgi:iron complex transport system substrate-binding protein